MIDCNMKSHALDLVLNSSSDPLMVFSPRVASLTSYVVARSAKELTPAPHKRQKDHHTPTTIRTQAMNFTKKW